MKGKDLKPHIGIFGRRNYGKSSLINCLTGQNTAIVSNRAGTTTDPVKKSIEITGVGASVIIDTAGIDDVGVLGQKRIEKTMEIIPQVDFALLLISENRFGTFEDSVIQSLQEYDTPYLIVYSKSDVFPITSEFKDKLLSKVQATWIEFNIFDQAKTERLINRMVDLMPKTIYQQPSLFKGIIKPKDIVLLVTPIDSEAPEGRMILPQVMAIRDILDNDAICVTLKETELPDFLKLNLNPSLVITDSQVFKSVSEQIPPSVPLTSFSIALARLKGYFKAYIEGTPQIEHLKDGDRILMLESCTHQVSCEDIGRFKLPNWIKAYTQKDLLFDFTGGLSALQRPIEAYAMVIQCGGCVVTPKQLKNRLVPAIKKGIPVSNYGMSIAYVTGIFDRVIEPFKTVL